MDEEAHFVGASCQWMAATSQSPLGHGPNEVGLPLAEPGPAHWAACPARSQRTHAEPSGWHQATGQPLMAPLQEAVTCSHWTGHASAFLP